MLHSPFQLLDETDPHVVLANTFIFNLHEEDYIFSIPELSTIHKLIIYMVAKYDRHMEIYQNKEGKNKRDNDNDETQSNPITVNQKVPDFDEVAHSSIKMTDNNSPSSSHLSGNSSSEWTKMEKMTLVEDNSENQENNTSDMHSRITVPMPRLDSAKELSTCSKRSQTKRLSFRNILTDEKPYLSLALISDDSMGVTMNGQPLGACFDEIAKQWIIADSRSNRLLMIPSMESIHHEWIKQPSALCILEEGVSVAALCAEYIQSYQYGNKELCVIAEKLGKTCRGLARTPGGNLLTVQKINQSYQIVIFHSGSCNKVISQTPFVGVNPCFVDMVGTTLAITDLGNQQVTMAFVDDSDVSNVIVRIECIHQKEWDGNDEPNGGFQFVSGIQLDSEGYSLIADASGRTIQLFDNKLKFCSRVPTDFTVPYTSAMVVNSMGEVLLCDRKQSKLYFAHLLAAEVVAPLPERINRSTNRQFGFRGRGRGMLGRVRGGKF